MNPLPSIKEIAAREAERCRHLLRIFYGGVIRKSSKPELRHGAFTCKRCGKPYRTRYRTRPKIHCKRCREIEAQAIADYTVVHRRELRAKKAIAAGRVPGRIGRPRLAKGLGGLGQSGGSGEPAKGASQRAGGQGAKRVQSGDHGQGLDGC